MPQVQLKPATWRVLDTGFTGTGSVEMCCPKCGTWGHVPTNGSAGAVPIGVIGMGVLFDPPGHTPPDSWLPSAIQCRACKAEFRSK